MSSSPSRSHSTSSRWLRRGLLALGLAVVAALAWQGGLQHAVQSEQPALTKKIETAAFENSAPALPVAEPRRLSAEELRTVAADLQPFVVEMRVRTVLPAAGAQSAGLAACGADQAWRGWVQFARIPTADEQAAWAARGVALEAYLAGRTWRVNGPARELRAGLRSGELRAAFEIEPADRTAPELAAELRGAPDSTFDISVLAADARAAESLAAETGARLRERTALGERLRLRADAARVAALAADARVAWIERAVTEAASRGSVQAASRDAFVDDSSNVTDVRDGAPFLTGTGVSVAVRELGLPADHVDYVARLTKVDAAGNGMAGDNAHATQVTGQVGGNGVNNPEAKGCAPQATLFSYTLNDSAFAVTDVQNSVLRGARISNHSYGPSGPSLQFGNYNTISADWDNALRAGNQIGFFAGFESVSVTPDFKKQDFFVGAKNTICVSAANQAAHAGDTDKTQSDGLASFSFFGTMNDGRIKPDLVAVGVNVLLVNGTNSSTSNNGTSFAAPACSGIAALALQHYRTVTGAEPSAALMKALLLNSATDLGQPGPDAKYGFGIINAEEAVNTVSLRTSPAVSPFIEDTVGNGDQKSYTVALTAGSTLKATLCWFDPAGNPAAAKALVNDLDVRLAAPSGAVFFPFSLNKDNPGADAVAALPNTVDPVEQIVVTANETGDWTLIVSGSTVPQGPQPFALVLNRPQQPPRAVAKITGSPLSGPAPLNTTLYAGAVDFGSAFTYLWEFGDGSVGTDFAEQKTYTSPGVYTVKLTVKDAQGGSAEDMVQITVGRRGVDVFAKSLRFKLAFAAAPGAADDDLQMVLTVPELVRTQQQAREAVRDGTFEGRTFALSVNGVALLDALVDRRLRFASKSGSFSANLQRGELAVRLKRRAVNEALGITAETASGPVSVPVVVTTEDAVYRATFTAQYAAKNGKGSGKAP